jgi:hypothetical protein
MRFSSKEEVIEAAEKAAKSDYEKHKVIHDADTDSPWQVCLNPYCTQAARACWQKGFDGAPRYSWEIDQYWDFQYQRGAAAKRIIDAEGVSCTPCIL